MVAGGLVVEPLHVAGGIGVETLLAAGGPGVKPLLTTGVVSLLATGSLGVDPMAYSDRRSRIFSRPGGSSPSKVSIYGQILPFKL